MNMLDRFKERYYKYYFPFAKIFYFQETRVYIPRNCHIVKEHLQTGGYEADNIKLLQAMSQEGRVIFDVGANIGLISIALLSKCRSCTVVAFEPSPETVKLLSRTARDSKFKDRWIVIPKAVGSETGDTDFHTASPEMSAFDGLRDTKRSGATKKIRVPVTTIDAEWHAMGNPRVSLIKIDVEGAELGVMQGAKSCIESEKPYIMTEWSPLNLPSYDCDPERLFELADEIGYRIFSSPQLVPVNNPTDLRVQMLSTENFLLAPCNEKIS